MAQWVKDTALLQLWLRFSPWPRNFYMQQVQPPPKKGGGNQICFQSQIVLWVGEAWSTFAIHLS